jgi:hypothetical protein
VPVSRHKPVSGFERQSPDQPSRAREKQVRQLGGGLSAPEEALVRRQAPGSEAFRLGKRGEDRLRDLVVESDEGEPPAAIHPRDGTRREAAEPSAGVVEEQCPLARHSATKVHGGRNASGRLSTFVS